ncbi:helix-turn-helix domain-containing protein [Nitratidesulfovibrio vulgaris]|uniref:helix-turn-helix domain-containing protein n=1 Tax=Nitratidesulfovibrio vulgaris TaxID=881 RepID=UPI0023011A6D|nr:helix-turn-helix domain-containing protein [Nitratidesulfovibrio vulgaris]WCB45732.1 helix-turn-helix domain-containing protein [Nitratidesulfovibrio vulgaris]
MPELTEEFHQLGSGEYETVLFEDVMKRFFLATNTRSQMEFAYWLGIRQSSVSDAKRRNRIPIAWLRELVTRGVDSSPSWVMTGKGPQFW